MNTPDLRIKNVKARQIFDSRGVPTVECEVVLECGAIGVAAVPSGASTGEYEAVELRDKGTDYLGKGVLKAVNNVNTEIFNAIRGELADRQYKIDKIMCELDGTENKSRLGANAILSVSLAVAKAAACAYGLPLYKYLGGVSARTLPVPMLNIMNGGAHASNNLDIQEFMIAPVGAKSFAEAMKMSTEIVSHLKNILKEDELSVAVGDEGGFAPNLESDEDALKYIIRAIEFAGYVPGKDVKIALDVASSEWYNGSTYYLPKRKITMTSGELIDYISDLVKKYPIYSVEDPLSENDWDGFAQITKRLPEYQIVGDDLFVTNTKRLQKGIDLKCANAILIKPNQIGSLTETLEAIHLAQKNGYKAVISHRSGETEDTTIADIAVATNAGQIKTGAPVRGERTCKYNRLLKIEEELCKSARYEDRLK